MNEQLGNSPQRKHNSRGAYALGVANN